MHMHHTIAAVVVVVADVAVVAVADCGVGFVIVAFSIVFTVRWCLLLLLQGHANQIILIKLEICKLCATH